jgi:hypothetical protein
MKPIIATTLALMLAQSAAADDHDIGEQGIWTAWNTVLTADVDTGWTGMWTLMSATVKVGINSIQFPIASHTLTVDYHGNYTMDYSTAHMLTASDAVTPQFTGTMDWLPPSGSVPSGVPDSCALTGQVSGHAGGKLFAPFDFDLDQLGDNGEALFGLPWIEAAFNPALAVKPQIVCPGADIDVVVKGGAAVMPVGAGRGAVTANGPIVPYDYEMDEALTTWIMVSRGSPSITYVWVK